MPTTFRAEGVFRLHARNAVVVFGDVTEGIVQPGMSIAVPLNGLVRLQHSITAVESLLKNGRSYVALCLEIDDPAEFGLWEALNIAHEELSIQDSR